MTTRLAVFSDVHGNAVALDAMIQDLARAPADATVCLGDAIQGGPEPARVVAQLRALSCPVVIGNADAFLLSGSETGAPSTPERRRTLETVRAWSVTQLSDADRAFIAGFAPTVTVPLGGGRSLLGFHGSPASFDEILLPDTPREAFERALGAHARDHVLAGGHVHLPYVRRIGDRFHFNPGSVGMAYAQGQPPDDVRLDAWAEYAVLTVDGDRVALEFRRVPYSRDALLRTYRESGRPFVEDAEAAYTPRSA